MEIIIFILVVVLSGNCVVTTIITIGNKQFEEDHYALFSVKWSRIFRIIGIISYFAIIFYSSWIIGEIDKRKKCPEYEQITMPVFKKL